MTCMVVKVEVHSTTKRAAYIVGLAIILAVVLIGLKRLTGTSETNSPNEAHVVGAELITYIAPVVRLPVDPQAKETTWSEMLALRMRGQTEVAVQNGRVDVLTLEYAIEVERLDKWHEGIGQSKHYATEAGKLPCLALIIEPKDLPLNEGNESKLKTIERTALSSGIKLLILVANET